MKLSLTLLATTVSAASAFVAPSTSRNIAAAPLCMSEEVAAETAADVAEVPEVPAAPAVAPINGWVPDETKPCYGLPGASAPFGYFDPLGFCKVSATSNWHFVNSLLYIYIYIYIYVYR